MAKLTKSQTEAIRAAHAALDRLAVVPPGTPDTPAAREARQQRTALEESFPDAFAPEPPEPRIIIAAD